MDDKFDESENEVKP